MKLDRARSCALVIGLVDRHQYRPAERPYPGGNLVIGRNQASFRIDNEHDDVRIFQSGGAFGRHHLVQRIRRCAKHPACIDERPVPVAPGYRCRQYIPRRPRDWRDDGAPRARNAIEERRLANVGSAREDDTGRLALKRHREIIDQSNHRSIDQSEGL